MKQLDLGENIKKYRKEMGLTQEGLAEAFGVTVGAISKWESSNTVPDILTLIDLADFFGISMDVLLGYGVSSKNVDDIVKKLNMLTKEAKHDEAMKEADKAIVRYPANFKVVLNCAKVYHVASAVSGSDEYKKKAIELYEKSLKYIAENSDPDAGEAAIRLNIAELKSADDPESALKELKRINFMGIADVNIAMILMDTGRLDEALKIYTKVLISIIIKVIQYSNSLTVALVKTGQRKSFKEACDVLDWGLTVLNATDAGKISYLTKMKVVLFTLKAMCSSCLDDDEGMRENMQKAQELAIKYDKDSTNGVDGKIRFWHADDDYKPAFYDELGASATESIDALFVRRAHDIPPEADKKIKKAKKYWDEIKAQ